ncbi:MAG: hypothetical protein V1676_01220 [Candidatus Diapherotrites archaeon]
MAWMKNKGAISCRAILQPLLVLALLTLLSIPIAAYIGEMNAQGRLSNSTGFVTGDYNIAFTIYNAESGGSALWTEIHDGANKVGVNNGYFSTTLGTINPIEDLNFLQDYWLGVNVENTGYMSPRHRLTPLPGCFTSETAQDVNCSSCISDSDADNSLTIATPNQVTLLGSSNFRDTNAVHSLRTGSAAQPASAGDVNLSGNLVMQAGQEIVMPDPEASGASSIFVEAVTNLPQSSDVNGNGISRSSVWLTSGGILQLGMPVHTLEYGATPVIDRINVYDYNMGATFYVDTVRIESVNPDTGTPTVRAIYTTDQTSGTEINMTSVNTTGFPYKMVNAPHRLALDFNVADINPHRFYVYGYEIQYHLAYTSR